ncbi:MAG TPA: ATP-binding protein [Thermoleophilaceae bacterium]|jgi:signal transduction histidine kinase
MRRRLILSTAAIALIAVIVLGVPLGAVEAARLRQESTSKLEREADQVSAAMDDRIERGDRITPALLRRYIPAHHWVAVTVRGGRQVTSGPRLGESAVLAHSGAALGGAVVAEAPIGELHDRVYREWLLIAALSLGGVLVAVALAALQARRLARPLEAIARRSAQLGDGDFSVRAGRFGVPEIDAIAQGLDSSAGRIAELVAREREFSANVSHQLRTPLTALRLRIEEAHAARGNDADLDAALAEVDRLETTIAQLLAHARQASAGHTVAVNLGAVVHDHASRWSPVFGRARRPFEVTAEKNVLVSASPGTVGQILDVLLDNALRHGEGAVRVGVSANGRSASVTVADDGPGIPDDASDQIFERGDSSAGGTGIGLHLARTLAQADNGSLRAVGGDTTRFELRLSRLAT